MAEEQEPYWIGRNPTEADRLNNQHRIWTKCLSYTLHPSIPPTLPPNAHIADIGTGTGILLTSLSHTCPPTYTFTGYDISPSQFPPPSSLASNISLQIADFRKPFPESLHHKYDVVYIRLVTASMGPIEKWRALLENVKVLVKRGGWVQWVEGDFLGARGFRGELQPPSSSSDMASLPISTFSTLTLTRAQNQLNTTVLRGRLGLVFPDFETLFTETGLVDVSVDVVSTDRLPEQRREVTEIGIGAVFGGIMNLAAAGLGGWGVEEAERVRREAIREMRGGAYLRWDVHVAVGRVAE